MKLLFLALMVLFVGCSNDAVSSHDVIPIAGDISSSAVAPSSSSREIVEHSSSSSAENLSSAEEFSSSESLSSSSESVESSSSFMLQESSSSEIQQILVEGMLWEERGVSTIVEKYAGDTSEIIPAGRFWLFKESVLSEKELVVLEQNGIARHSVGRLRGKDVILFTSESDVPKAFLDSVLASFYNAVPVNDTTPLSLNVPENYLSDTLPLLIGCWPDIDIADCIDIVESCGGGGIEYARNVVLAQMPLDSVQCVGSNRDIYILELMWDSDVLLE